MVKLLLMPTIPERPSRRPQGCMALLCRSPAPHSPSRTRDGAGREVEGRDFVKPRAADVMLNAIKINDQFQLT